ncbi:hypothetical protein BX616_009439 [Lobosporangium transversale]|nr:hypothetical protein BX616_009439 [Lobosporangium transversale]
MRQTSDLAPSPSSFTRGAKTTLVPSTLVQNPKGMPVPIYQDANPSLLLFTDLSKKSKRRVAALITAASTTNSHDESMAVTEPRATKRRFSLPSLLPLCSTTASTGATSIQLPSPSSSPRTEPNTLSRASSPLLPLTQHDDIDIQEQEEELLIDNHSGSLCPLPVDINTKCPIDLTTPPPDPATVTRSSSPDNLSPSILTLIDTHPTSSLSSSLSTPLPSSSREDSFSSSSTSFPNTTTIPPVKVVKTIATTNNAKPIQFINNLAPVIPRPKPKPVSQSGAYVQTQSAIQQKARKELREEGKIKRSSNCFIKYRTQMHPLIVAKYGNQNNKEISKLAGQAWRKEPEWVKSIYRQQAIEEKLKHEALYPTYKYSPSRPNTTNAGKKSTSKKENNKEDMDEVKGSKRDDDNKPSGHPEKDAVDTLADGSVDTVLMDTVMEIDDPDPKNGSNKLWSKAASGKVAAAATPKASISPASTSNQTKPSKSVTKEKKCFVVTEVALHEFVGDSELTIKKPNSSNDRSGNRRTRDTNSRSNTKHTSTNFATIDNHGLLPKPEDCTQFQMRSTDISDEFIFVAQMSTESTSTTTNQSSSLEEPISSSLVSPLAPTLDLFAGAISPLSNTSISSSSVGCFSVGIEDPSTNEYLTFLQSPFDYDLMLTVPKDADGGSSLVTLLPSIQLQPPSLELGQITQDTTMPLLTGMVPKPQLSNFNTDNLIAGISSKTSVTTNVDVDQNIPWLLGPTPQPSNTISVIPNRPSSSPLSPSLSTPNSIHPVQILLASTSAIEENMLTKNPTLMNNYEWTLSPTDLNPSQNYHPLASTPSLEALSGTALHGMTSSRLATTSSLLLSNPTALGSQILPHVPSNTVVSQWVFPGDPSSKESLATNPLTLTTEVFAAGTMISDAHDDSDEELRRSIEYHEHMLQLQKTRLALQQQLKQQQQRNQTLASSSANLEVQTESN